jgi:hypothetical protein
LEATGDTGAEATGLKPGIWHAFWFIKLIKSTLRESAAAIALFALQQGGSECHEQL